jgi:hypothetical protein
MVSAGKKVKGINKNEASSFCQSSPLLSIWNQSSPPSSFLCALLLEKKNATIQTKTFKNGGPKFKIKIDIEIGFLLIKSFYSTFAKFILFSATSRKIVRKKCKIA